MPKATKSSASSGTRKKHARKAVGDAEEPSAPSSSKGRGPQKAKPNKKQRGQKSEPPRVKQYIAPSKPLPVQRDPLDVISGLQASLPGELVVALRSLGKKATVTRVRALEELDSGRWVRDASTSKQEDRAEGEAEDAEGDGVELMTRWLPVWAHHLPSLLTHHDRRIRLLSSTLSSRLLSHPQVRTLFSEEYGTDELVRGCMVLAANDVDPGVRTVAGRGLKEYVTALSQSSGNNHEEEQQKEHLRLAHLTQSLIHQTILSPLTTHARINPPPPPPPQETIRAPAKGPARTAKQQGKVNQQQPQQTKGQKGYVAAATPLPAPAAGGGGDDEEGEDDKKARLRVGALGALRWSIGLGGPASAPLLALLSDSTFWSALHLRVDCPFVEEGVEVLGAGQPLVRRAAWGLVVGLVKSGMFSASTSTATDASASADIADDPTESTAFRAAAASLTPDDATTTTSDDTDRSAILALASTAILRSAWSESEGAVLSGRGSEFWEGVLGFLRAHPNAWLAEASYPYPSEKTSVHEEHVEDAEDDEHEDSGAEDEEEEDPVAAAPPTASPSDSSTSPSGSKAYAAFLEFLATGCRGNPVQGYPAVLVVLSGIPDEILLPAQPLFTALWSVLSNPATLNAGTHAPPVIPTLAPFIPGARTPARGKPAPTVSTPTTSTPPPIVSSPPGPGSRTPILRTATPAPRVKPVKPGTAWAACVLECAVYVLKRSYAVSEGGVDSDVNALVVEQAMAIWDECVGLDAQKGKGVKVDREAVVRSVGRVVRGFLRDGEESRVFGVGKKLQEALVKRVREDVEKLSKTAEGNDSEVWRAIRVLGEEGVQVDSWKLRNVVLEDVLGFFSKQEQQGASGVLREGLDEVGGDVWADGGVGNMVDDLLLSIASGSEAFSTQQLDLIVAYFAARSRASDPGAQDQVNTVWNTFLLSITSSNGITVLHSLLRPLTVEAPALSADATQSSELVPRFGLRYQDKGAGSDEKVQSFLRTLVHDLTHPNPGASDVDSKTRSDVAAGMVRCHAMFMSEETLLLLVDDVVSRFRELGNLPSGKRDIDSTRTCIELLNVFVGLREELVTALVRGTDVMARVLVIGWFGGVVFGFGFGDVDGVRVGARSLWDALKEGGEMAAVRSEVVERVKGLVNTAISPEDVLSVIDSQHLQQWGFTLSIEDVLPSRDELDNALRTLNSYLPDFTPEQIQSLRVTNVLIPPSSLAPSSLKSDEKHDNPLDAPYIRYALSLIHNRQVPLRKGNEWMLRHVLLLDTVFSDLIDIGSTGPAPVASANEDLDEEEMRTVRGVSKMLRKSSTYLLVRLESDAGEVAWKMGDQMLRRGASGQGSSGEKGEGVKAVVSDALDAALTAEKDEKDEQLAWAPRVLERVLVHALEGMRREDADKWVRFGRTLEKTSPQASLSILSAVNKVTPAAPLLDRYRNELAASLLGIKTSQVSSEGLKALYKLNALAPELNESDVVFLPQARAVNLMKVCQKWIGGSEEEAGDDEGDDDDEEAGEEVESEMTAVFANVVTILQSVPGSHWSFMFDVVENNLENASTADTESVLVCSRTLRLLSVILDVVESNGSLREDYWERREKGILRLVRDMVVTKQDSSRVSSSRPQSLCREQALSIVQVLPESLIESDTLPAMCHLLSASSSIPVQRMAYRLLQVAAKKRTETMVLEVGVDTERNFTAKIPVELLELVVGSDVDVDSPLTDETSEQAVFGYLLSWMITFDLFENASFKVKSDYIEQLKAVDAVSDHLIPMLFSILGLDRGLSSAIKMDSWGVEEFFVHAYEPGMPYSIQVLAGHLYYRALLTLPSLVYSWIMECKDRQLSAAVHTYTSQYFSPILISTELALLKNPQTMGSAEESLEDENFTVKVFPSVNEVMASYLVDEHQLELKLKVPGALPLQRIEVKEVKKVGVDDLRWRAWMLSVQQIIWSRNGSIADALRLFKKNVMSHFAGQVECAICYSTISMIDGQLPRKPCKTCKNKFHSGCLYKWFNSSHSSSCPLCRSDIL